MIGNRILMNCLLSAALALALCPLVAPFSAEAQSVLPDAKSPDTVSTDQFADEVTAFLGKELSAHLADVRTLDPPQERVVGALAVGEFSWGTFLRALASYSALTNNRSLAGQDVPQVIGKIGLIEARSGGKAFSQMYAAIALRSFGTDLKTNPLWQSLTPQEQAEWRSLLDPARFYDRKTRHVINLPENYFGVAARVVSMDYQLGIINDRVFVDDLLDRAAEQFTSGALYSDDNIPTGRYDRYSNEYARYVYEAAENVGRKELMQALEPTLKAQMRTWWDLLSPDGYGYPWGRSLGVISYIDTLEIVGFLSRHPQFRPAPLSQLASAYYVAWQSLMKEYQPERHLLNVLGFGHGNYAYITLLREWQQTTAFFGKASGAHQSFLDGMKAEHITSFPSHLQLPDVARFEYFRKGNRLAGVWLVRQKDIRFVLPITTGTKPGVSDYLPAPYNLSGFAPPVEQQLPTITPYLELADGRVIVAGDGADEISPGDDGHSLRAVWRKWALVGGKAGQTVDTGLATEVTWSFAGNVLARSEKISATEPVSIKRFWVAIPSTGSTATTSIENGRRTDTLEGKEGGLQVSVDASSVPFITSLQATGNSALGKGSRGPVPLILNLEASGLTVAPGRELTWKLSLRASQRTTIEF
ncbi:MAG TPA: hypothetical protein VN176_03185 [Verrucomicrobiae bacterium]|jgi:hypothetical protein|nr:hypothetical protein [Verrucomicrobiae bacterium]